MIYRLTLNGLPFHQAIPDHATRLRLLGWRYAFWMRTNDWQAYKLELAPTRSGAQ
jgi:hypothetical protein